MLNLSLLKFKLVEKELLIGTPKVACTEPFKPKVFSFFKIIFRIPAVPSASYRADGLVITSTRSIASAGNC